MFRIIIMIGLLSSCAVTPTDHYKACVHDLGCSQAEISRRWDAVLEENHKPPHIKPRYI